MTVEELIEDLKKYHPQTVVVIYSPEYDCSDAVAGTGLDCPKWYTDRDKQRYGKKKVVYVRT